jgi:hypothetical protein
MATHTYTILPYGRSVFSQFGFKSSKSKLNYCNNFFFISLLPSSIVYYMVENPVVGHLIIEACPYTLTFLRKMPNNF